VPWNFPLALSFPKLAPALLTGCSVVLKPPHETPLFGSLLAEVFAEAGLPPGVLNVVAADREVAEGLVRHPLVDKSSFTGHPGAGAARPARVGPLAIAAPTGPRLRRAPPASGAPRPGAAPRRPAGRRPGARRARAGGRPPRERGYFVEPTLFAGVENRMTIAQ